MDIDKFRVIKAQAMLVIVDIQDRLVAAMQDKHQKRVITNVGHLTEASRLLDLPLILTEQYPKGLGPTVSELKASLPSYAPVEKITFSCCGEDRFMDEVEELGRRIVILAGMETHVCVLQTCLDLLSAGYRVHMVSDAICSRHKMDYLRGLEMARDAGAVITSTEIVLFELLERAGSEAFKAISKRIR